MKNIQIKLEYNEDKIKAIRVSLKLKNKDFDEEMLKFLDGLYNKSVPKILKKYIEIGLGSEDKDTKDIQEVQNEDLKQLHTTLVNNNKKH